MQKQPLASLILALVVAFAPLTIKLPPWAVLWVALGWSYVLLQDKWSLPQPTRFLRLLIFFIGVSAVVLASGMRFDGQDFITLLAVMAGIKPLEVQSRRDSMVTVFLACFLTMTSLFVFESLSMTLYLFVSVWVTTGVLIQVNEPDGRLQEHFRLSARLILVALPLMVLLFLLFPRLSGSYWGSPWTRQGHTGFSNNMRIGDVSRLALNTAPAFSVSFAANTPKLDQLYWRGIVFQEFDGRTWKPSKSTQARQSHLQGKQTSQYTVMLEPHGSHSLFALDLPVTANIGTTVLADHTLHTRRPVHQRFSYSVTSMLDYRETPIQPPPSITLDLPAGKNPKALALGRQLATQYKDPLAIMRAGLNFYTNNSFSYTLQPGPLGADAIDDFLFISKKGFCEHFAASYAVLMRAAGLPARLVGGYQGGHWNSIGNFFTVRQSDAHVWCELWFKERGWVRVDPTFTVAPDRIDQGLERALTRAIGGESQLGTRNGFLRNWIATLQMTWEAINTRWNMWFMGFSAEDQMALLKKLGISFSKQAGWVLVMALPSLFILFAFVCRRVRLPMGKTGENEQAQKIYHRFLQKTARIGLPKPPSLGPQDYASLIVQEAPELADEVREITRLYIALRYRSAAGKEDLKQLRRCVIQFRPEFKRPE